MSRRRVGAVLLLGRLADVPAIQEIAVEHGLAVLEDAAQAVEAAGIAASGLAAVNFNKLATAGAGRALLLTDDEHADQAR